MRSIIWNGSDERPPTAGRGRFFEKRRNHDAKHHMEWFRRKAADRREGALL